MLTQWKKRAQERLPELFAKKGDHRNASCEANLLSFRSPTTRLTRWRNRPYILYQRGFELGLGVSKERDKG